MMEIDKNIQHVMAPQ